MINNKNYYYNIEYYRGYYDGYKEGYNKAVEELHKQFQMIALHKLTTPIIIKCYNNCNSRECMVNKMKQSDD